MKNSLMYRSIKNVLKQNVLLTACLCLSIGAVVVFGLIPPQLLRVIIDSFITAGKYHQLWGMAVLYLAVLVFTNLADFVKEGILIVLGQKITADIRYKMMVKSSRIHASYFTGNDAGTIVSRFTNDVETINSLFTGGIISMAVDCFKIAGIICSMWYFSSILGMMTLVMLPIIYFVMRAFQKLMLKAQMSNRVLVGKVNNHISETLKNVRMVKVYSREKYMEDKYKDYLEDNFEAVERVNWYDSIYSPCVQLMKSVAISLIVVLSSDSIGITGITLGMVAGSIDLLTNLFAPVESLGMELQSIQKAVSGVRRIDDFYNEKEDEAADEKLKADNIVPEAGKVDISFNDVSFSYANGVEVLKNISFKVAGAESVAFVGRTGVGKTTLFNLVMGLYKPTTGTVTVNGTDVYYIPKREKRRLFGYVSQNFSFVQGSVADQIALKDESISRQQVEMAVEFVGLGDYVSTLCKGYDTDADGGSIFSQGQKQLLAIARAIVTDPPILLLDEITANLDSITEQRILSVLHRAGSKRTILSISHRFNSMIDSDRTVILVDGSIKSTGTTAELMRKDSWYRQHLELENRSWS